MSIFIINIIMNIGLTSGLSLRAGGRGFPSYYECGPQLLSSENRRKIEPKEIPSCLIPGPLVIFTQQLEILVTTLLHGLHATFLAAYKS